jgi:hypothetical protein
MKKTLIGFILILTAIIGILDWYYQFVNYTFVLTTSAWGVLLTVSLIIPESLHTDNQRKDEKRYSLGDAIAGINKELPNLEQGDRIKWDGGKDQHTTLRNIQNNAGDTTGHRAILTRTRTSNQRILVFWCYEWNTITDYYYQPNVNINKLFKNYRPFGRRTVRRRRDKHVSRNQEPESIIVETEAERIAQEEPNGRG